MKGIGPVRRQDHCPDCGIGDDGRKRIPVESTALAGIGLVLGVPPLNASQWRAGHLGRVHEAQAGAVGLDPQHARDRSGVAVSP